MGRRLGGRIRWRLRGEDALFAGASRGQAPVYVRTMPFLEVNGIRLLVNDRGSGEPLVLVHGSWVDCQSWVFVEEGLATSLRVVSYDRRGHTGSDDSPAPGSRRDDEDDLAALIETYAAGSAHIVGNSFGGSIALGLASRRPELVRSVCVHEPPLVSLVADDPVCGSFNEGADTVVSLIESGEAEAGARHFVDEVVIGPGTWDLMPPEAREGMTVNAETFVGESRDPNWAVVDLEGLGAFSGPVLLTYGDQSPAFLPMIVAQLAEAMDQARVTTIPGAGHVPHLTHPDEWVTVVKEFVGAQG